MRSAANRMPPKIGFQRQWQRPTFLYRLTMLKKILGAAVKNVKRFFAVWLVTLIANQFLIFGACFAPHCLAAAVPHTLAIALLINLFGFRQDRSASHSASAPAGSNARTTADLKSSQSGQREQLKHRGRLSAILAMISIGVIGALILAASDSPWKSDSTSIAAFETAGDKVTGTEVPHERLQSEELHAESRHYYARQAQAPNDNISHPLDEENGDEFDINDIQRYEQVTKKKYLGTTVYNRYQLDVVENVPNVKDVGSGENSARTQASKIENQHEQRAMMQQAYECSNSAGKVGVGTGRLSQASEYSSFLKREVRAGEFVLFKYQGSGKEYWFKVSSCTLL